MNRTGGRCDRYNSGRSIQQRAIDTTTGDRHNSGRSTQQPAAFISYEHQYQFMVQTKR
ncbi:hypothetical protein QUA71_26700 [Microcoleus sp. MON1_C5]|uniref:hypothetical protein n=1 Tax=Microcoleus sp. MON1_C5 TaxID=2818828 RepID=UPI002FD72251